MIRGLLEFTRDYQGLLGITGDYNSTDTLTQVRIHNNHMHGVRVHTIYKSLQPEHLSISADCKYKSFSPYI